MKVQIDLNNQMSLIVFHTRLLKKTVCSTNRSLTSSYLKLKVWIFEANSKCFVEFQQNKSVSEMTKIKQIICIESLLKLFALLMTHLRNKVILISLLNFPKKKIKFTRYNNILHGSQSSLGPFTNNILNGPTIYQ